MCGLMAGWLASTASYPFYYYYTVRLQSGDSSVTSKRKNCRGGPTHREHHSNVQLEGFVSWIFTIIFETHATSWLFISPPTSWCRNNSKNVLKVLSRRWMTSNLEEKNDIVVFANNAHNNANNNNNDNDNYKKNHR